MQESGHPLINQEHFTRDLIAAYKDQPMLWDKDHPHYRNRAERNDAIEVLLQKCREYYPEADEDFVKMKIDSLRSCFRKEWNKVRISKACAKKLEDVYKPSLWYYNLLLYTVGEKCSEDTKSSDVQRVFWPREYSTMLIGLLKRHPCLYVNSPVPTLAKRSSAIKKITDEMNAYTGKSFTHDHIRKKIQLLKGQYRYECKKIRDRRRNNPKHPYKSNLWCFNLLNFLKGHVFQKTIVLKNNRKLLTRSRGSTPAVTDSKFEVIEDIKIEIEPEQDSDYINKSDTVVEAEFLNSSDYDDIFDTIGKNVAHKLRDMEDDQREFAEKLINQVMYYGLMENLTHNSRLSLDDKDA